VIAKLVRRFDLGVRVAGECARRRGGCGDVHADALKRHRCMIDHAPHADADTWPNDHAWRKLHFRKRDVDDVPFSCKSAILLDHDRPRVLEYTWSPTERRHEGCKMPQSRKNPPRVCGREGVARPNCCSVSAAKRQPNSGGA
jgi:hypothetical protein